MQETTTGGKIVRTVLEILPMNEADIQQYFGKIRNGKTYIATSDILKLLKKGNVVYANWQINWEGYREFDNIFYRILGFFGLKTEFKQYPKENLKYLPITQGFYDKFSKLTDCYVFLDEGHLAFDSYLMTKMDLDRRASILHTGHFNRAIRIISQRPTNIHVQMRANVNMFIQCEKILDILNIRIFRKTFYEEMTNQESVDLEQPSGSSLYFGSKRIYNAYDSKYLRGDTPKSQDNVLLIETVPWREQVKKVFRKLKLIK